MKIYSKYAMALTLAVAMWSCSSDAATKSDANDGAQNESNSEEQSAPVNDVETVKIEEVVDTPEVQTGVDSAAVAATVESVDAPAPEPQVEVVIPGEVIQLASDDMYRPNRPVSKLTVLDFNATWCVPCRKLSPAMEAAAEKIGQKIDVVNVDIDLNPQTASAFMSLYGVDAIPFVLIITPSGDMTPLVGLGPFMEGGQDAATIEANLIKIIKSKM